VAKNVWRDTSRSGRFFIFDAKAVIPLFLFLAHIRWWTFYAAMLALVGFGVLERFGISITVAFRLLRAWIAGPIRYGVAWWHKPQKRIR
jgi:intracellular multiplication protein IcmT